jgi:8-oxo-dGTP diphosphatase
MSLPCYWELPRGKIEPNESSEASLIRETQEELNCTIKVVELVADATHEYPTVIVRLITYLAQIIEGTPSANEHEQLLWLSIDQLHTLIPSNGHQQIYRHLRH